MGMAYGTKVHQYKTLDEAGAAAIAKHSHYYTDPAGWVLRAEAVSYATSDEWGEYRSTGSAIELFAFPVERWTPCGATIKPIWGSGPGSRGWVDLRPYRKQWASRTARDAIEQLKLRRVRQAYILKRQLARAETEQALADAALSELKRGLA